jgi:hypothetical protein
MTIAIIALLAASFWAGKSSARATATTLEDTLDQIVGTDESGDEISIPLAGRRKSLFMFVISDDCRFCDVNTPRWESLTRRLLRYGDEEPSLLLLSTDPAAEIRQYIEGTGIEGAQIITVDVDTLRVLGVEGTPTTILVGAENRGRRAWIGVLSRLQVFRLLLHAQWAGWRES